MKTVYAYHPETFVYIGTVQLGEGDISPMESTPAKPVFLVPGNCLEESPPACPPGKFIAMVVVQGVKTWTLHDIPDVTEPPAPPAPPAPPELTVAERIKALSVVVQRHLDGVASVYGYGDEALGPMASAVSYAEESAVPKFQDEGRALRAWRSLVWAACYELLAKFQAGVAPEPTADELVDILPPFPGVAYRENEAPAAEPAA